MGAIPITEGQLGIATTAYSSLKAGISFPASSKTRIQHVCSNSTVFPTKDLGYIPTSISGAMLITGASVDEFVIAVNTGTSERKVSFFWAGAEHYVYAYSGDITSIRCVNPYGSATRQYEVGFSFPLSRSKLYKSSDDSVVWGS